MLLLPSCSQMEDKAYALLLRGMYAGTVPTITPAQLHSWMQREAQPVLLDTRSEREYQVSHLAGARLMDYSRFNPAQLQDIPKNAPIVVYCSVGYRSERVGEQLQAAGYTSVRHLQGGLFMWINQGQAVYNAHGQTNEVHAYTYAWGWWLRKGKKVYD